MMIVISILQRGKKQALFRSLGSERGGDARVDVQKTMASGLIDWGQGAPAVALVADISPFDEEDDLLGDVGAVIRHSL